MELVPLAHYRVDECRHLLLYELGCRGNLRILIPLQK
jgi:hypothetical protein